MNEVLAAAILNGYSCLSVYAPLLPRGFPDELKKNLCEDGLLIRAAVGSKQWLPGKVLANPGGGTASARSQGCHRGRGDLTLKITDA